MSFRRTSLALTMAASAIALIGVTQEAQAGALGFATTQISNFTVSANGTVLTNPTTIVVASSNNTESASATFNGASTTSSVVAVAPAVNNVCLGNCTVVNTQPFQLVTPTLNPATTPFAQAATQLGTGNIVAGINGAPAGANSNTAAQTQLLGANTGQGNASDGNTAGFILVFNSTTATSEDVTGTFDAFTQLLAQTDAAGTTGLATSSFSIKISENGVTLFSWAPNGTGNGATGPDAVTANDQGVDLNQSLSADFPNQSVPYMASGTGLSFVADLPTNVPLNFAISQTNIASATSIAVPEPMSLALFGAGLFGLGVFVRRRRQRA